MLCGATDMRFYRLHYHSDEGGSAGFRWYTDKAEMQREMSEAMPVPGHQDTFEEIDIPLDGESVLAALNRYAGHPDNS
jgi:hypothetical protein